jgi:histidine triad (HIT) family protein
MSEPCVFCEIVAGRSPANYVAITSNSTVFEPLDPVTPGHILVVPDVHVTDFADDPEITATTMRDAALLASEIGGEFNLITSKGPNATQTIRHFHVHLVPRRPGDGLALPWTPSKEGTTA